MKFSKNYSRYEKVVSIQSIISNYTRDSKLEKSFTIQMLHEKWYICVGDIISSHCIPTKISGKTLYIQADHSVYANELMINQDIILENIHSEIPDLTIERLRIEVK